MSEFLRAVMNWMEEHGFDCSQWSEYSIQCKHRKLEEEPRNYGKAYVYGAKGVHVRVEHNEVWVRGAYENDQFLALLGDPELFTKIAGRASEITGLEIC